jgi:hypothetical protein
MRRIVEILTLIRGRILPVAFLAAQERFGTGDDILEFQGRLIERVFDAQRLHTRELLGFHVGGHDDDRRLTPALIRAQHLEHDRAVHLGHAQVEHDQFDGFAHDRRERVVSAVGGRHLVPGAGERDASGFSENRIIIDDQNL